MFLTDKSWICVVVGRDGEGENVERWGQRRQELVALLAVRGTAYHHWSHVIDWLHWFGVTSQDLGGGIDTTPWMNTLCGHWTSLVRLWLLGVLLTCFTRGEQIRIFFSFFRPPSATHALPGLDLTIHLRRLCWISQCQYLVEPHCF